MARSAGEVKADIALIRAVIARDLEALHRHVPRRSWVSYSWLAGGLAVGLGLSGVPVLAMVSRGLRVLERGTAIMGIAGMLRPAVAELGWGDGHAVSERSRIHPAESRGLLHGLLHGRSAAMMGHRERAMETSAEQSHAAPRVAEIGREGVTRAVSYVRDGVDRATGYAQQLSDLASERIVDVTGQPPEHWARQLRQFVEQSPRTALVMAIAIGYVVGRGVRRG